MNSIPQRLSALRALMKKQGVTVYYVPGTDPHQSEYVPVCWQRRQWLSGFTGSAGELLVTTRRAGLWTDGRYFLQAAEELHGSSITLFKLGQPKVPTLFMWLEQNLSSSDVIGIDPKLISIEMSHRLRAIVNKKKAKLKWIESNLVDAIWGDRPSLPKAPVVVHPQHFAGETVRAKLKRVRLALKRHSVDAHVVTTLDAIAWLFNLRGSDVAFNPVFIAYALITEKSASLFVDMEKMSPNVLRALKGQCRIEPYDQIAQALNTLGTQKRSVLLDGTQASAWIEHHLKGASLISGASPINRMKAQKNETEIEGARRAHQRDGVALVRFWRWFEEALVRETMTEIGAAKALYRFRAQGELFQGESFSPIAGYAEHGAIIHYSATEHSDATLKPEGLFLLDTGAQYLDGTTDITRTVLLGKKATREQQDCFTRVLKGHIALARCRFPKGTSGRQLDTIARLPLWESRRNYNHGTGHGVGSFLCVHEGPQSINATRCQGIPLEAGNILSNEPGFYQPGAFGIRTENLVLVCDDFHNGKASDFLCFETLTRCPIDTRLIDVSLMDAHEIAWLNDYHRRVFTDLKPFLNTQERTWLREKTKPIPAPSR